MMSANYEQQRLQINFTFKIVEAVKRIKIHLVSNTKAIPIGLSMATGIILTILGINPNLTIPEYVGVPISLPLPSETKVLKTGEIPVNAVKIYKTPIISSQQDKGKGGEKLPNSQNAVLLAPS